MKTKPDYFEGYHHSLKNANDHLKAAQILKEEVGFGMAFSHLVLSAEEACKAAVLFSKTLELGLDLKTDHNQIFSKHTFKLETIRSIEFTFSLFSKIREIWIDPITEKFIERQEFLKVDEVIKLKNEGLDKLIEYFEEVANGQKYLAFNSDWWIKADRRKQKGLYVDLNKRTNTWETPDDFTAQDYLEGEEIVKNFVLLVASYEHITKSEFFTIWIGKVREIISSRKKTIQI